MNWLKTATTFVDNNKGKISLAASAATAAAAVFGYEPPVWLLAILATQGVSTTVRRAAGNAAPAA